MFMSCFGVAQPGQESEVINPFLMDRKPLASGCLATYNEIAKLHLTLAPYVVVTGRPVKL